jgi:excinuclease ABC subunit A
MRDLGNSVLVVEHDAETMLAADHVLDLGPGAGLKGGEVVFSGPPDELLKSDESLTGQYLAVKNRSSPRPNAASRTGVISPWKRPRPTT